MQNITKLKFNITVLLALLCVLTLVAAGFCAGAAVPVAEASAAVPEAVTAGEYGDYNADDLWYFHPDEINLAELREYVSSYILPALRANNVEPVVIAVIDTGINLDNSLFDDVLLRDSTGKILGYSSYYPSSGQSYTSEQTGDFEDETTDYHGTRVASIMAVFIKELGLEEFIKIYPVRASFPSEIADADEKDEKTRNGFTIASINEAIKHAVSDEVGADVVNLSLCSTPSTASAWANNSTLVQTVAEAVSKSTVVAAAGNDTANSDKTKYYPAAYDGVVGVMASAEGNKVHKTTNYGSAYDLFAPGESIMTTSLDGTYVQNYEQSGTSMAAPFVSVGAALLKLRFYADRAASGEALPRATVLTRLLTTLEEGDKTVQAQDGKNYKKMNLLELVRADYSDFEGEYMPVNGLDITATDSAGKSLNLANTTELTVRTIRQNGQSRVNFSAITRPYGDTDPAINELIEWYLVEFEEVKDESGKVTGENIISTEKVANGKDFSLLFDREGKFRVYAKLVSGDKEYVTAEAEFNVKYSELYGSQAYIVPADYIASDDYVSGRGGNVPYTSDLYGKDGITLTVTSLEDVKPDTISWYVNGKLAAQYNPVEGATKMNYSFTFTPDKFGTYEITAKFGDRTIFGSYTVEYKSYAQHPAFVPVWCAIAVWIVQFAVIGACIASKRKQKKAAAVVSADEAKVEEPKSPIRKK